MTSIAVAESKQKFPKADDLPVQAELPNPLIMPDGQPVPSVLLWNESQRQHLKSLVRHYIYGYAPPCPKK